jgi:beta-lactamase superfamily II metal-dependent hydrolase
VLSYGEIDFLFTGDATTESENGMLADEVLSDVEMLKVGHHGSRYSSSQAFLDIVGPEVAIYMAAEGNTYGHPHPETITALEDIGAEVYGTDVCGTIIVTTNGTEYTISMEVNDDN